MGQRIEDLAPNIFALVPTRIANKRTVAEALEGVWRGLVISGGPSLGQLFSIS